MQSCQQRPVEQVLYHGTSESAVLDICAHGFNRSFCGRNGKACAGQGGGPAMLTPKTLTLVIDSPVLPCRHTLRTGRVLRQACLSVGTGSLLASQRRRLQGSVCGTGADG
jgi:hypothetical protein